MTGFSERPKWELTWEALDALLAALDADRTVAAEKYELLRARLTKFFEWRGLEDPQERADATLNRVAHNLEAGEAVRDVSSYARGVARLVALETARDAARVKSAIRESQAAESKDAAAELHAQCLHCCLAKLTVEERHLIVAYYQGEGQTKIAARKRLAEELGVPQNALRIRACRIRATLEECLRRCIFERDV
jgi:DNA-directed RNA polymerase specialized sigma24 family protein